MGHISLKIYISLTEDVGGGGGRGSGDYYSVWGFCDLIKHGEIQENQYNGVATS